VAAWNSRRRHPVATETEGNKTEGKVVPESGRRPDLAVAPERSYNLEWVCKHDELFAEQSPLFVLGCHPVEIEEMRDKVENLCEDFCVIGENVPEEPG